MVLTLVGRTSIRMLERGSYATLQSIKRQELKQTLSNAKFSSFLLDGLTDVMCTDSGSDSDSNWLHLFFVMYSVK